MAHQVAWTFRSLHSHDGAVAQLRAVTGAPVFQVGLLVAGRGKKIAGGGNQLCLACGGSTPHSKAVLSTSLQAGWGQKPAAWVSLGVWDETGLGPCRIVHRTWVNSVMLLQERYSWLYLQERNSWSMKGNYAMLLIGNDSPAVLPCPCLGTVLKGVGP